jgi:hypothetical protein
LGFFWRKGFRLAAITDPNERLFHHKRIPLDLGLVVPDPRCADPASAAL